MRLSTGGRDTAGRENERSRSLVRHPRHKDPHWRNKSITFGFENQTDLTLQSVGA